VHRLGYAQVLYREISGFSNFAISFTIISILAGCLTSYCIAFNNGGPSRSPGVAAFPSVAGTRTGTIFVVYSVIIALHLALNLLNVNLVARLRRVAGSRAPFGRRAATRS
jgi:hypothetical protein